MRAVRNRVRSYREKRRWTLKKLAAVVGTGMSHLSRIERGLVEPQGITKERIADALGVKRDTLFPEDGEKQAV